MRGCVNLVLFSSKQACKHAFLLILETTLLTGRPLPSMSIKYIWKGSREKNRILATENYRISDLYCNAMSKNMKQETIRIRMALPGRPALSWRRRCGTACRAGWSPATWFVSHVSLLDSHTFRSDSGNSFYFEFNYS